MNATEFVTTILNSGQAWCLALPGWHVPFDDRARVLLTAIAGQESNWAARVQSGNGPAHGFWQFERVGGVVGVLSNKASTQLAHNACDAAGIECGGGSPAVWELLATEKGDHLATAFARLLLWTDANPLPDVHRINGAWDYYVRNWRPGKPSRARWAGVYPQAVAAVTGASA